MNIENLIDELDNILETQKIPFLSGKLIINTKEFKRIIEDLRLTLPKEILQAKTIVADRSKIIDEAKFEAKTMIDVAHEKIKHMAEKEEVLKIAKEEADEIIRNAKAQSKEIRESAANYVFNLMKETDVFLSSHLAEIRRAKQSIRSGDNINENSN